MVTRLRTQRTKKLKQASICACLILMASAQAASAATIQLSPKTGNFELNSPFTVDMIIADQSELFNAAQANVIPSDNLKVSELSLGDCNFSFVITPSTSNPSFVGVSLGSASKQCTVYTLTLIPKSGKTGYIEITDGSVKRFGNAIELLTATDEGAYAIQDFPLSFTNLFLNDNASESEATSAETEIIPTAPGLYTLRVKVTEDDNTVLRNADVTLHPPQGSNLSTLQIRTDANGYATFTNIPAATYTVTANTPDGKRVGSNIMHVSGKETVLTLGLQEQKETSNSIPILIAAMIAITGVLTLTLFRSRLRRLFRKK